MSASPGLAADGTLIARALGRLRPRYDAMVLLTQADLDEQGRMGTRVGREVRDALADFRVTGAPLLPVLVPGRVGVDDLVSQRLLVGDRAAHAGPGREVVEAYARLVDYLLERVPAAAGPGAAGAAG